MKKYDNIKLKIVYSTEELEYLDTALGLMIKAFDCKETIPGLCWLSRIIGNLHHMQDMYPELKIPQDHFENKLSGWFLDSFVKVHLIYETYTWQEHPWGTFKRGKFEDQHSSFLWKPFSIKPRVLWLNAHRKLVKKELLKRKSYGSRNDSSTSK